MAGLDFQTCDSKLRNEPMTAMELHAAHRNVEVKNAEFLLMYDGPR